MKNCRACRKEFEGDEWITVWPPETMPMQFCSWSCLYRWIGGPERPGVADERITR